MTGEAKTWARALDNVKRHAHLTLPGLIEQLAATHDERLALIGDTEALTYRSLAARTNNYARWAMNRGIAGTKVALLMHNCPDYVAIWLGLTRVGCTVALLNTNLRSHALSHCINISCARHLIASDDLVPVVDRGSTLVEIVRWPLGTSEISDCSPVDAPLPDLRTVALLVYTSGTTGMPKAAKVTHRRVTEWSFWFAGMTNATQNDRLYNCLPMYHSIGGIVAIGSMLVCGASVVIRPRFSSSRFWRDVCTIAMYHLSIHRRALPIPSCTGTSERWAASVAAGGRQWLGGRRLAGIPGALRRPANPRVLCGDRRCVVTLQLRG